MNIENISKMFEVEIQKAIEIEIAKQLKDYKQQNNKQTKLYYNLKEVEQITGLTRLAIKGRINRGTIKAAHNSTTILIPKSEIENLLTKLDKQCK